MYRSESGGSGQKLHGPWASKLERREVVGMLGVTGAQSLARGVHAPRTMAPWREGDAGTVALAALVRRAGAVPSLELLPACSAWARSLGSSARRSPRAALRTPPRSALPCPLAYSSS